MRFSLLTFVGLQLLCGTTLAAPFKIPHYAPATLAANFPQLVQEQVQAGNALPVAVQKANDRLQAEELSQATGDIPTTGSDGVAMAARSTLDNVRTTYPDDLVKPVVDIVTFQGRRVSVARSRDSTVHMVDIYTRFQRSTSVSWGKIWQRLQSVRVRKES